MPKKKPQTGSIDLMVQMQKLADKREALKNSKANPNQSRNPEFANSTIQPSHQQSNQQNSSKHAKSSERMEPANGKQRTFFNSNATEGNLGESLGRKATSLAGKQLQQMPRDSSGGPLSARVKSSSGAKTPVNPSGVHTAKQPSQVS